MDASLRAILEGQTRTVTVLSSLIAIQEELGYLRPGAIPAVAEHTRASVNEVYGVATFYTHFRFTPPGEHQIELCRGPSCHVLNAPRLRGLAEEFVGIKGDGTTPDSKYTLRALECAGACAQAPVAKVDGKLYGQLTEERLRQVLANLNGRKAGDPHGR